MTLTGLCYPWIGFSPTLESCFLLDTSEDWGLAKECTLILQDKGTLAAKLGSHPEELRDWGGPFPIQRFCWAVKFNLCGIGL